MKKNYTEGIYIKAVITILPVLFLFSGKIALSKIRIYPAPQNEILSKTYKVNIAGKYAPVYTARVGAADDHRRFKAVDDLMRSDEYFDTAAFCYFDLLGSATVSVTVPENITSVKILPASSGIKAKINKRSISFIVSSPQNLTVEINGQWVKSLHIFVNPFEKNVPKPTDANVIYFGPGVHEVSNLIIGDNKTVYIAGGAIIKTVIGKNEQYGTEPSGLKNYPPSFILAGKNIRFCGRGVLDATALPTHAKNFMYLNGANIVVEGVIFRNSSSWTVPVRQSNNVLIDNIKILGYRANSDGIDICNSSNVVVKNCFVRTNDDLIVVKTWENQGPAEHIVIQKCVLWNQLAHALSIGAELRENVNDILFTDCDIIHDQGREWSLRIFQSDASIVSNVRFENLNIEESHQLASLWTGKVVNSMDKNFGSIKNVVFKNIKAFGSPLKIELTGSSASGFISGVSFNNVRLNNRLMEAASIQKNAFVNNISVNP